MERFDLETVKSFLPLLWSMGVDATVTLERPGFMQAGGGVLGVELPYQLYLILPYAMAIVALVLVARRAAYPQALMKPYRKGER